MATEQEIITFRRFWELTSQANLFDEKLLKNDGCGEPADLVYEGQAYQITTGDGSYIGKILSSVKEYPIDEAENRSKDRGLNKADVICDLLLPILAKKSLRADSSIVLIVTLHNPVPFNIDELGDQLRIFSSNNQNLLNKWKVVWCVFSSLEYAQQI